MMGIGLGILGFLVMVGFFIATTLRRVVPTNEVHTVQSSKRTISFGSASEHGNTYYAFPAWLPIWGVNVSTLPVSVFDLDLNQYEAYDSGRLPFLVDIKAFFRITDPNMAAQRVANFDELHGQLKAIVQGTVRSILASYPIEQIMAGRGAFGDHFTKEVVEQLANWGVSTVKNIELMDIKDAASSSVIKNITAKKNSQIEMESRTEVALNKQKAKVAEIEAEREVELINQSAKQTTGLRQVEVERQVSLEKEKASQVVKEEQRVTKEKEMAVVQTEQVKIADINKEVNLIKAEQDKAVQLVLAEQGRQTSVIKAEGELQSKKLQAEANFEVTKKQADGQYETQKRNADGVAVNGQAQALVESTVGRAKAEAAQALGLANAEAAKAMEMAPVTAQITLAKEIGANKEYQNYLVTIKQIEANQAIGEKQAGALTNADVKMIITGGDAQSGLKSVGDVFSAKGGTQLGAMLEGLKNTEVGAAILKTVIPDTNLN